MSCRFNGDPDTMVKDVWEQLASRSHGLGLWVGIDGDEVVGHLLAFIRLHDGQWVVWVSQVEADTQVTRELKNHVLGVLGDFADQWNLVYSKPPHNAAVWRMRMCTPRSVSVWGRYLGFEEYRVEMQRELRPRSPR